MLQSSSPSRAANFKDPYEDPEEAYLDGDEEELVEPIAAHPWWQWLILGVFLIGSAFAAVGCVRYLDSARPEPKVVDSPQINARLEASILAAISPGWPDVAPTIQGGTGEFKATAGHITGLAAADLNGKGQKVWGVSYVWYGPPDTDGARAAVPAFAIVSAEMKPKLLYKGPGTGGWDAPRQGSFEATNEVDASVEAVHSGLREVGFMYRFTVESSRGGHLTHGHARLYNLSMGHWLQAWEGESEFRLRTGHSDEVARTTSIKIEDRDGDGIPEIITTPSHYVRHLMQGDKGPHFMADGPGDLVYKREGDYYRLSALSLPGHRDMRIRTAPPLFAVRATAPVHIDGEFDEWDVQELGLLSGIRFDDQTLLKYKRRDPDGLDDLGGEVNLMWDERALYVRAVVLDNVVVPGAAGADLYKGDNLSIWLDTAFQRDFEKGLRDGDDWQIGLSPARVDAKPDKDGVTLAQAWCWVPKPGTRGVLAASKPLYDPYNQALRGYRLEAAIPWSGLGGPPVGLQIHPISRPMAGLTSADPRRYHLGLAGIAGVGLVLSDADTEYQELGFVSNSFFAWAEPKTFNTLLLVEPD